MSRKRTSLATGGSCGMAREPNPSSFIHQHPILSFVGLLILITTTGSVVAQVVKAAKEPKAS